jgi:predicted RNA binding protein YcfA (HicA-like mRNA interferase family)
MAKTTTFSAGDLKKVLESAGFSEKHCGNGSHKKMAHDQTGHSVAIPDKDELGKAMAKKLLEEAGLSELWEQAMQGAKVKDLRKQANRAFMRNAMQPACKLHTSPGAAV